MRAAPDGTLVLGAAGDRIDQARGFFAVIERAEERRLTTS
jgi:hypothetical protein